eukprot:TRINITY_DN13807_c0_g1_i1.p1 TRINITY_DN13807_c0_g1~~TRINITY_DN13807_c0_g1_i1.p1  ORF type:complete len:119 (+),score=5.83 TRINITY_DN13807_c0_g1_i1:37-393(+)
MGERSRVRYSALNKEDADQTVRPRRVEPLEDLRFKYNLRDVVPWQSIGLALFLLAFGTLFLLVSHLIFSSHMGGDNSQAYGFLILGVLLFLPGFYETRIAYYSWRGCAGYTFSRIPAY